MGEVVAARARVGTELAAGGLVRVPNMGAHRASTRAKSEERRSNLPETPTARMLGEINRGRRDTKTAARALTKPRSAGGFCPEDKCRCSTDVCEKSCAKSGKGIAAMCELSECKDCTDCKATAAIVQKRGLGRHQWR